MLRARTQPGDPLRWSITFALGFWLLVAWNLAIPHKLYFDEIHYVPAAQQILAMDDYTNQEHPLVGKLLIAVGLAVFGDTSWGWRIMSSLASALALLAAMRALWFASMSRAATLIYGFLLVTGFFLIVHARIAMLDPFMIAFLCVAYWQLAGAMREPETGRRRLAIAGVALGLALGSKWNAIPLAILPGVVFFFARLKAGRRRLLLSRRGAPVPGITLVEAGVWLGIVPLAVYGLSFAPGFFFDAHTLTGGPLAVIGQQEHMLKLQESVKGHHPYQTNWWHWVSNWRGIWYLFEAVDGAQRGVLLIGNPLTILLGLPAVLWCLWQGVMRGRAAELGAAMVYLAALALWVVAPKPVQFFYHYFAPSMALYAALALALARAWEAGWRKSVGAVLAATLGLFVYFLPILTATPIPGGDRAFEAYTWLDSWR